VPELSDGLISLREWRADDAPALAPLWSESAARSWITKLRRHRCAGTEVALAITRVGEDVPVGNVSLERFSDGGLSAALGYWLVPAARGEGLTTAAARLLCRWGFEELGLERVELLVEPGDAASQRVAERLGARADDARLYVTPTELSVSR
jgi:[ribosomal protein S5]-alanine N-acetyltransferase